MKLALIVSGILAALVWMAPQLVILGYVCLIIPGLILTIAPTAFVYLAVAVAIRSFFPKGMSASVASLGLAIFMGWLAMQPMRTRQLAAMRDAILPDVGTSQPLQVTGRVRIELPTTRRNRNRPIECDHLCAALLSTPGVSSVTVARGDDVQRFRLCAAEDTTDVGILPTKPGQILEVLDHALVAQLAPVAGAKGWRQRLELASAIEADWILRLATQDRLLSEPANKQEKPDWVIRHTEVTEKHQPNVHRIEVVNDLGEVVRRLSYVESAIFAPFFGFDFDGGSASSGFQGAKFRVARRKVREGDRTLKENAYKAIVSLVVVAPPRFDSNASRQLADTVEQLLNATVLSPVQVELIQRWLAHFSFDADENDLPLIGRILEDNRVPSIGSAMRRALRGNVDRAPLRAGYVSRLLNAETSQTDRRHFALELARLPSGTFENPTPDEQLLLNRKDLRDDIGPFFARIADQGLPAVEALKDALVDASKIERWNAKRRTLDAVREGFTILGSDGSKVIPVIRELFLRRPSPILRTAKDATQWRFTLVRLGLPLEEIPFFANQNEQMKQREFTTVRRMLARYENESKN